MLKPVLFTLTTLSSIACSVSGATLSSLAISTLKNVTESPLTGNAPPYEFPSLPTLQMLCFFSGAIGFGFFCFEKMNTTNKKKKALAHDLSSV